MPFAMGDVSKHTKKATTDKLRKQWVKVANGILKSCQADGVSLETCEARAIKRANGVIKKQAESKESEENTMPDLSELDLSKLGMHQIFGAINDAFQMRFDTAPNGDRMWEFYSVDFLSAHPDLGQSLIVSSRTERKTYAVPVNLSGEEIAFGPPPWTEVQMIWEAVPSPEMTETDDADSPEPTDNLEQFREAIRFIEADNVEVDNPRSPLTVRVAIIKAGFGNKEQNHYYAEEVLSRDGHVFQGVKMHRVDHQDNQRSEQTEVSVIEKVLGLNEHKELIGEAIVFDPDFAEKTRNRAIAGQLDSLHCSIVASGTAHLGEVDGRECKIVDTIDEAFYVDWVTQAGAGGHAQEIVSEAESETDPENEATVPPDVAPETEPIAEAETPDLPDNEDEDDSPETNVVESQPVLITEQDPDEPPDPDPTTTEAGPIPAALDAARVSTLILESGCNLPSVSVERLQEGEYPTEDALIATIAREVEYIKRITGSGTVFGHGASTPPQAQRLTDEQIEERARKRFDRIKRQIGSRPIYGG